MADLTADELGELQGLADDARAGALTDPDAQQRLGQLAIAAVVEVQRLRDDPDPSGQTRSEFDAIVNSEAFWEEVRRRRQEGQDVADDQLRTYNFHERHALVRIDVKGWTYRGVCQCGHVGPRIDGWPEHHHDLLREHLGEALTAEAAELTEDEAIATIVQQRLQEDTDERLTLRESAAELGIDLGSLMDETPEETVRQAIASGRLEGAPEPTPEQVEELLAIARGEVAADEVVARILQRLDGSIENKVAALSGLSDDELGGLGECEDPPRGDAR